MRASGKDDAIKLTPAIKYSLEQALDFIEDDELVEVTPKEIRLRKKQLTESARKRASRAACSSRPRLAGAARSWQQNAGLAPAFCFSGFAKLRMRS
jgi:hypothetical protein